MMKKYLDLLVKYYNTLISRNVVAMIKKEISGYFYSLIAYIILVVFLFIIGYFFAAPLFIMNSATLRGVVDIIPLIMLFIIPALTMRLYSEEIKSGTIEILYTQPVYDYEILFGKYFSAVLFYSVILATTLIFPLILILIGSPDIGQIVAQYIGLFFTGAMFISVGIFSSVLTKNQVISYLISFLICFAFFMIGKIVIFFPGIISDVLGFIGLDSHYSNITRGVVDTRDLIYFISIISLFLYSALASLRAKR